MRNLIEQADGSYRLAMSQTDHARLASLTDAQITAAAESDPDSPPLDEAFWQRAVVRMPERKKGVFIRLDPDVLKWFQAHGRGYQTRINAILKSYVQAQQQQR